MTDQELTAFVRSFRDGILEGRPSFAMCFMVCSPLVTLLRMHGVECELVESEIVDGVHINHVWIKLSDGRVLDPTVEQFDGDMPPVYLGPPTKYHGATVRIG